jgi:protocatechuate 3,4-dioxygenase beta subunit
MSCGVALGAARTTSAMPGCTLTPEQEQGPYYIDTGQLRSDITEAKPGVPLKLRIALVGAKDCAPLANAAVDIWHCDAGGVYSGIAAGGPGPGGRGPGGRGPGRGPGGPPPDFGPQGFGPPPSRISNEARFLRGVQVTNESGVVEFTTIYPGWYEGRTIHIHLKVHTGGHVSHTGQLFLPEEITDDVARLEPYVSRKGVHRTTQAEDMVFQGQHGASSMTALTRLQNASNAGGFRASATLAVDPEASPAPVGFGGGRGPGRRG